MKKEYIKPLYKVYTVRTLSILAGSDGPTEGGLGTGGDNAESKGANINWDVED